MSNTATISQWQAAAADPTIEAALQAIYAQTAEAIATRGPACWASGRCCDFDRAGHRLYVTGLETAWTLAQLEAANTNGNGNTSLPQLQPIDNRKGACPYQDGNLCGAHAMRPLGCRVYFCDESAQAWQHDLYEAGLAALRELHDAHNIPYEYAEWRATLLQFTS